LAHREGHEAHVAGLEVERAGVAAAGEHGHAAGALDPILPVRRVRVPVQLAQSARLDIDQRRRRGRNREVPPVRDADRAVRRLIGSCAVMRWLNVCGTGLPDMTSDCSGPGSWASKMYFSLLGICGLEILAA